MASSVKQELTPAVDQNHKKHSLKFIDINEKGMMHTCNKPCTVFEVLKRNKMCSKKNFCLFFRKEDKNIAIPLHFPCWLIEEEVTIKNLPGNKYENSHPNTIQHVKQKETFIFFIERKGGKNCASKIFLDWKKVDNSCSFLCVYAFSGETIMEALERDGRFLPDMLKNFSSLYMNRDKKSVPISEEVTEDFHEMYFKVEMPRGIKRPHLCIKEENSHLQDNQDTSSAETKKSLSMCSTDVHAKNSSTDNCQSKAGQDTKRQKKKKKNPASQRTLYEIPDSEEVLEILRSQFEALVNQMKSRYKKRTPQVLELLKKKFGKNTQGFTKVNTIKRLMKMSDSVCKIRTQKMIGTGFLFFCNFILTNQHVINDCQEEYIEVIFNHEDHDKQDQIHKVKKIVACCHGEDQFKRHLDYALLELDAPMLSQPRLLAAYKDFPKSGGLCLIGHPQGGEKMMDPTSIIEFEKRGDAVDKHENYLTFIQYFRNENKLEDFKTFINTIKQNENLVTYNTCFYEGSSGSPVLTEDSGIVAMHTGGFTYEHGKQESVIEYAIPLGPILEDLISKIVEQGQHNVLFRFLMEAVNCNSLKSFIERFVNQLVQEFEPRFENVATVVIDVLKKRDDFSELRKKLEDHLAQKNISNNATQSVSHSESDEEMEVEESTI